MAEFYRFRSTDRLLGKSRELDRQVIYFADPAELNDPMEGFRDMVWSGDGIAWTNLFKHYAYCLHWAYLYVRIAGFTAALQPEVIPITAGWNNAPTPRFNAVFTDIWNAVRDELQVPVIVDKLVSLEREARRGELLFYLHNVHLATIAIIRRVHSEHDVEPQTDQGGAPHKETLLTGSSFFELLSELGGETEFAQQLFSVWSLVKESQAFQHGVSSMADTGEVPAESVRALFLSFPQDYVLLLEKLLWPSWYASCFSKSSSNSSSWGTYGDSHKGVCLIFSSEEEGEESTIEMTDHLGSLSKMTFRDIEYTEHRIPVEFFRNIGRLPRESAMELWYRDESGNTSECASHLLSEPGDSWIAEYWQRFERDITTKTRHWEHEQESRLILHSVLEDELDKSKRFLTYDFKSLAGIIFGIRTSYEDKRRIIDIVQEKCVENNRQGFHLFQAFYSPEHGEIRTYDLGVELGAEG